MWPGESASGGASREKLSSRTWLADSPRLAHLLVAMPKPKGNSLLFSGALMSQNMMVITRRGPSMAISGRQRRTAVSAISVTRIVARRPVVPIASAALARAARPGKCVRDPADHDGDAA